MIVEQLMTRPVWTCRPTDTVNTAAQVMWEQDVGAVVVTEDNKVVGVVTDRDICMAAYFSGKPLADISVESCMAKQPALIDAGATVAAAERLMREKQLRRLPVVNEDDALIGIVSLNDIAREARRQKGNKHFDVTLDGVAGTLAIVGQPRRVETLAAK